MKAFIYLFMLMATIAIACSNSNSPAVSSIIDSAARRDDVVTDTQGSDSLSHMDTTELVVDSAVNIAINGTPLSGSNNAVYHALYNNWLHAYTEVHHLPAVLHITYIGTVMMGARGDIMDEILNAQNDMKNYIAKDKYRQSYDALNPGQQAELQQQHPVLFQNEFR